MLSIKINNHNILFIQIHLNNLSIEKNNIIWMIKIMSISIKTQLGYQLFAFHA